MALASATLASVINFTPSPSTKLFLSSSSPLSSQFSLHSCSTLRITLCHAKFNDSTEGEVDEIGEALFGGYDEIEEDEEEEAENSVDLLIRFLRSMFKKVSFAVDGTLLLASLSIVKAFLEVICTLGGTVFAGILLLRVIWAAVAYFQSSGNSFNQGGSSFGATT